MGHKITLAFSTPYKHNDHMMAKAIRYFDKSRFDHALLIIDDELVSHAIGHGLTNEALSGFIQRRNIVEAYTREITDDQYVRLMAFIKGSEGKSYGWFQLLAILITKVLKIDWIVFRNGTSKYICSEYCAETLSYLYAMAFKGILDVITPRELRDDVQRFGGFRKLSNTEVLLLGSAA